MTATLPRTRRPAAPADHPTPQERAARGEQFRTTVPLEAHAEVPGPAVRPDPVSLLEEQATTRVPELVPIRYGRMLVSPFTFLRGAAKVMASDLAATSRTNLEVQLCGDAHLSNFGLFGSPERRLIFDTNDFDETLPGPFEWDLKRLCASLAVTGRMNGLTRKQRQGVVTAAAARYRSAMADFAEMRDLDVWYMHIDTDDLLARLRPLLDAKKQKLLTKTFDRARTRDSVQAFAKLTAVVDGSRRIVGDPPLIVPLRDLLSVEEDADLEQRFNALIRQYRRTLLEDRRVLLERYRFVDMARKVVGVGSVGTRCWIVLMLGRDEQDPLFMQVKEAEASVLEEHLARSEYANHGQRVVTGQRMMQQASDIFLGWQRTEGIDGVQRDFYVRQLRDWKGSLDPEAMLPKGLRFYGQVCAWSLARAHARSGDRIAIAGYLGTSDTFDRALAAFAESYADLTEHDHTLLQEAAKSGRITAESGV